MNRFNQTEIIGVNAIERIFIAELNWLFRMQPLVDVGIDAMIEAVMENLPTGKFIGAQIKSGKSNFHSTEKSWTYYASDIHYNYWTNCNIPVILIGYILEEETAYWIHLIPENFIRTKRRWKIDIPKKQKLNSFSQKRLMNLVNPEIENTINQKWTEHRIEILTEKAGNISKAAQKINEFTDHMSSLRMAHDQANDKFRVLIAEEKSLTDYQSQNVVRELISSIKLYTPLMESKVNEFSKLFAIGAAAFQELVEGCKEMGLDEVLTNILPSIADLPSTADTSITQIDDLRQTVDNFSKKDRALAIPPALPNKA